MILLSLPRTLAAYRLLYPQNWTQLDLKALSRCILLFSFALVPLASAPAAPEVIRVPFHSARGLVLLDGQLNGKAAVFLLDTGSNVSFVDMRSAPLRFKAEKVRRVGMGGCIVVHARVNLGDGEIPDQKLCVADLSDISKDAGERVDGFLGEDTLRQFSSVRIDYRARVVELER